MEGTSGVLETCRHTTENYDISISHIPDELLLNIFSLFNINELPTLSLVCRKWKDVSFDQQLYDYLFKTYFPKGSPPPLDNNENWHPSLILKIDREINKDDLIQEFKQIPACEKLMKTLPTELIPTKTFITLRQLRDIHNLEILYSAMAIHGSTWKIHDGYKELKNGNKIIYLRKKIIEKLNNPSKPITKLAIVGKKLTSLPREIAQFSQLESLYLRDNKLTCLPAEIGKLTMLRELHLSRNMLTRLPVEIGNLLNLKTLDLKINQLTRLPAEIGKLKELEAIEINDNKITSLPLSIKKLPKINGLVIRAFESYATEE